MKTLRIAAMILFTLGGIRQGSAQCTSVVPNNNPLEIVFENECLTEYINNFGTGVSITNLATKVEEKDGQYFLLVRGDIEQGCYVYIIPLALRGDAVRFKRSLVLNACQTTELSIDHFTFHEGKVNGCNQFNHLITRKY